MFILFFSFYNFYQLSYKNYCNNELTKLDIKTDYKILINDKKNHLQYKSILDKVHLLYYYYELDLLNELNQMSHYILEFQK